jgi:GT2 family glycosyltransferase/glycosyltransferase involved in cell wall biosynthesis
MTFVWRRLLQVQGASRLRIRRDLRRLSRSPLFDAEFYLQRNPDLAAAGADPALHYLTLGGREGRDPSAWFSSTGYLEANPDVAASPVNPLVHYLRAGPAEKREVVRDWSVPGHGERDGKHSAYPLSELAPRDEPSGFGHTHAPVDIIVPVYNGVAVLLRCLNSVLGSISVTPFSVIIIDDASPDPSVQSILAMFASDERVTLLRNEVNLGFVGTVNRGMRGSTRDVVLLNSDTEVTDGWLDRLAGHAAAEGVCSVTPMSNNATVYSFPSIPGGEDIDSTLLHEYDSALAEANAGRSVEIPTGHGFCMFITRRSIEDVGLFDQEAFGRGYGEENDFCLRGRARGWRHLLATDTFVYHQGSVSFSETALTHQTQGMEVVRGRYPTYLSDIARYVEADPAAPHRISAVLTLLARRGSSCHVYVAHRLGGGVDVALERDIAHQLQLNPDVVSVVLRPSGRKGRGVLVEFRVDGHAVRAGVSDAGSNVASLASVLATLRIEDVVVHHTMGYNFDIERLVRGLSSSFAVRLHDFYAVCPQVNLADEYGEYCGEPGPAGCAACLSRRPAAGATDIESWRLQHNWLFRHARRVTAPSADAAMRLSRHQRGAAVHVEPNLERVADAEPVCRPVQFARRPEVSGVHVAVLGTLAVHKGYWAVRRLVERQDMNDGPVHVTLLGAVDAALPPLSSPRLVATGPYDGDGELAALLRETDPDVIWFAARWPETFSFTLSTAMETDLPIVAPRLGAFVERLEGFPRAHLYDPHLSHAAMAALLLLAAGRQSTDPTPVPNIVPAAGSALVVVQRPDGRRGARRTPHALVIPELLGQTPSPCAFIRLLEPLRDLERAGHLTLSVGGVADLRQSEPDLVITHRTAVSGGTDLSELLMHVRTRRLPLVVDMDDDLIALGEDHPEASEYAPLVGGIRRLLAEADVVWASTPLLAERLELYASTVELHPNALSDGLWFGPGTRIIKAVNSFRLLYMGTASHAPDWKHVRPAVMKWLEAQNGAASITLVGVPPSPADLTSDLVHVAEIPSALGASYPAFVSWLRTLEPFDVGIAPLTPTEFNRGKSGLKHWEYTALGTVTVASDIEPYQDVIEDGRTGFLVDGDAWSDVFDRLIVGRALLASVGAAARADLADNWTLGRRTRQRSSSLTRLLDPKNKIIPLGKADHR